MSRKPLTGILILLGGAAVMALKCLFLLRTGSRSPHIPERDEL